MAANPSDSDRIINALNSVHYPIGAAYIAKLSGLDKKVVNRTLSDNANALLFEKLEHDPPLWRRRTLSIPNSTIAALHALNNNA